MDAPRTFVIALIAFLTLIDLFAAQPILPMLAAHYGVAAGQIGAAANASTLGMAAASLAIGAWGARLGHRSTVTAALALLAIPTAGLAFAPDLTHFAVMRVIQGVCMATAFSLTMAYLGETFRCSGTAVALGAYVTGNVGANLFGRLLSATVASHLGLQGNFFVMAALNLAGACLVFVTMRGMRAKDEARGMAALAALRAHLTNPRLLAANSIGFCILFAFIGVYTYVNFVLSRPPIHLSMMALGAVYFVFLPALLTTPRAAWLANRLGMARAMAACLVVALVGLALMLSQTLVVLLAGMVLVACGTFMAQALATGFVGREAAFARSTASGLYLAAYFTGGLAGSAVVGRVFDSLGWNAAIAVVALDLAAALILSLGLRAAPAAGLPFPARI
jgi:predicted MFS family arabinose efflux permease